MSKVSQQAAAAAMKTAAEDAFIASQVAALATFETAFTAYLVAKAAADALPDDPPPATFYNVVLVAINGIESTVPTCNVYQTSDSGVAEQEEFSIAPGDTIQIQSGRRVHIVGIGTTGHVFSGSVNSFPITVDTTITMDGAGPPQFVHFTADPT